VKLTGILLITLPLELANAAILKLIDAEKLLAAWWLAAFPVKAIVTCVVLNLTTLKLKPDGSAVFKTIFVAAVEENVVLLTVTVIILPIDPLFAAASVKLAGDNESEGVTAAKAAVAGIRTVIKNIAAMMKLVIAEDRADFRYCELHNECEIKNSPFGSWLPFYRPFSFAPQAFAWFALVD